MGYPQSHSGQFSATKLTVRLAQGAPKGSDILLAKGVRKRFYLGGELTRSMGRYKASFEVDSKTDSYAVRRILEQAYNTIREESRSVREGSDDANELLQEFKTLRDVAKQPSPGRLTITYEQYDGDFDD